MEIGNSTAQNKTIQLTGEQKKILTLPVNGAVLIKGCAGSGKTLVAAQRAEHLRRTYGDLFRSGKVGIFAFNREIVNAIQKMIARDATVEVQTLDKWVFHFLKLTKDSCTDNRTLTTLLREARDEARRAFGVGHAILQKMDDFYKQEIAWIKGRLIKTAEEYFAVKRTGRGTADRVTAADRRILWAIYANYQHRLAAKGLTDFDDRILRALAKTEMPSFEPPFTHVVIDEAQDLTLARLTLLSRLVKRDPGSVTIIADAAQRIYSSGFAWRDVGFNVQGRSFELKQNYRNTRQISEAAMSLLAHEGDGDKAEYTAMLAGRREGMKPVVRLADAATNYAALKQSLRAAKGTQVVAAYQNRTAGDLARRLLADGFAVASLGNVSFAGLERLAAERARRNGAPSVSVCSFHSLKGLEFDRVFLWDLSSGTLPGDRPSSGNSVPDEEEVSRSRKVLYVAMTRAREELMLFCNNQPSSFVTEIAPDTVVWEKAESLQVG